MGRIIAVTPTGVLAGKLCFGVSDFISVSFSSSGVSAGSTVC